MNAFNKKSLSDLNFPEEKQGPFKFRKFEYDRCVAFHITRSTCLCRYCH